MRTAMMLALAALSATAVAAPTEVNHQGRLFDALGAPLTSTHNLDFALYDNASGTGTAVWTESHAGVAFDNGYFSVMLGETSALDDSIFDGGAYYLGIAVDSGAEITTRPKVVSVPYALNAGVSMNLVPGADISVNSVEVGGTTVIDSSGNIDATQIVNMPASSDTLLDLGCGNGDVARYDGSAWQCTSQADLAVGAANLTGTVDIGALPVGTSSNTVAAGDDTRLHVHDPNELNDGLLALGFLSNMLDNGGFEDGWASTTAGTPAARWYAAGSAPTTLALDTDAGDHTGGAQGLNHAGASDSFVYQPIENWSDYIGRTVTVSIDVKVGGDGAVIEIDDGATQTSQNVPVQAGFNRITVTHTVAAGADKLAVKLFGNPAGSFFDDAMLILGDYPSGMAYAPVSPIEAEARLLRWYETGQTQVYTHDAMENGPNGNDATIRFSSYKASNDVELTNTSRVRYYCVDYYNGGGDVNGTRTSLTQGGWWAGTWDCDRKRCEWAVETQNGIQGKYCLTTFDWVVEVDDTTF